MSKKVKTVKVREILSEAILVREDGDGIIAVLVGDDFLKLARKRGIDEKAIVESLMIASLDHINNELIGIAESTPVDNVSTLELIKGENISQADIEVKISFNSNLDYFTSVRFSEKYNNVPKELGLLRAMSILRRANDIYQGSGDKE